MEQGQIQREQGQTTTDGFATLGTGMAQITALFQGLTESERE